MDFRYAIFDMDGTLVDSMPAWVSLGRDYLISKGVTPPEDLRKIIAPLTMTGSAAYFREHLGVKGTDAEIVDEMHAMIIRGYLETFSAKPGALDFLRRLSEKGVRMCLVTATAEHLASRCMDRLGMGKYFEFIISCETVGKGKDHPDVYHLAAERFGASPAEIAVFEDAPYAAKTAKDAGFYIVGVYDSSVSEARAEKMKTICDRYLTCYPGCET